MCFAARVTTAGLHAAAAQLLLLLAHCSRSRDAQLVSIKTSITHVELCCFNVRTMGRARTRSKRSGWWTALLRGWRPTSRAYRTRWSSGEAGRPKSSVECVASGWLSAAQMTHRDQCLSWGRCTLYCVALLTARRARRARTDASWAALTAPTAPSPRAARLVCWACP